MRAVLLVLASVAIMLAGCRGGGTTINNFTTLPPTSNGAPSAAPTATHASTPTPQPTPTPKPKHSPKPTPTPSPTPGDN